VFVLDIASIFSTMRRKKKRERKKKRSRK